jgi:hypothetical protein
MANLLASYLGSCGLPSLPGAGEGKGIYHSKDTRKRCGLLAATFLLVPLLFAQGTPHVTGVEPTSGKVNDSVTVRGEYLGKGSVSAVFLSDDNTDYKATLLEQTEEKIVMKVPQVKPGDYHVSIQEGNKILILPIRFEVQE